jgi:hypothetical protein
VEASEDPRLSAQVILRDRDAAARVAEFFSAAGLETDRLVGISFAISGPASRFRAIFGGATPDADDLKGPVDLPPTVLPGELAAAVEAIAIPGPPKFGAGNR